MDKLHQTFLDKLTLPENFHVGGIPPTIFLRLGGGGVLTKLSPEGGSPIQKKELLSLIEKLAFGSKVIRPGRMNSGKWPVAILNTPLIIKNSQ